jgi:hypothetical protein
VRFCRSATASLTRRVSPSRRATRVAVPALLFPLLLGACGGAISSNEAVISGNLAKTSADELEKELELLTDIPSFRKVWTDSTSETANVGGKYSPKLVAWVLQNKLFNTVIREEAVARKLEPEPATEEMATRVADGLPGGQETFNALPDEYRSTWVLTQQYIESLLNDAAGDPKKYFDANPNQFTKACVKHILVADEATAKDLKAKVEGGQKFEDLAKEFSIDPGSKDSGGDLGCTIVSTYVKPFADAAATVPENKVSDPVQSEFGYHLLIVSGREPGEYNDDAKNQAIAASRDAGVDSIRTALSDRIRNSNIKVNPEFAKLSVNETDPKEIPEIVERDKPGAAPTSVTQ